MINEWSDRFIYIKNPVDRTSGIDIPRANLK